MLSNLGGGRNLKDESQTRVSPDSKRRGSTVYLYGAKS